MANGTSGHESELINVQDLKSALQKFKTDKVDVKVNTSTTVNGHALSGNVTVSKSDVGLGNVSNDAQVKRSEMGAVNGVATLDSAGKVPSSQLPSYVDDVLEYDTKSAFPATGEAGKIYVDKSNNTTWRWSGSAYTQIKGDIVIGTTSGTAADGGTANTHYNNTSNPHSVTKAQVGLGSVVNTGDSATPVSGGTTKFTTGGAYTELAKKVDKVTGKGLSTNDYTTDEKNKLAGIASGAEVNVQSDWNATSGDAMILNKPTSLPASDVSAWAKASTKPSYTLDEVSDGSTRSLSDYIPYEGGMVITAAATSAITEIAENTNLNNIVNAGTYYCRTTTIASTLSNTPYTDGNFRLWHIQNTGSPGADTQYSIQIILTGSAPAKMFIRGHQNTVFSEWREVAYLSSNVASATKLQTARTIWGQSFDGTANVSGNMTGVGSISASDNVTITKSSTGETKFAVVNNKGSVELITATNRGVYDRTNAKWLVGTNGTNTRLDVGNVGIGTNSPSYKLHVVGEVGATKYNNTSDIRKKDIIENLNLDVNDIANAPIFKFTWLDPEMPEGVNVGTSAQYWQTILPEIVSEANDDEKTLSMQYGVAGLVSSVALAKKVVEQEETIKAQEARIKALEDAIANIQNMLNK